MTAKAQGQGASALVDLTDVSGTPDAGKAPVSDGAGMFPFTDVATQAELDAHVNDATDAHDASAISVVPFGSIAATNAQAALEEIVAEAVADLGPAVILAPASSARNVIQPTAGAVIAAIVKAHAAQSVDLTQWQDSTATVLAQITKEGRLSVGGDIAGAYSTGSRFVVWASGLTALDQHVTEVHSLQARSAFAYFNTDDRFSGTSPWAFAVSEYVSAQNFGQDGFIFWYGMHTPDTEPARSFFSFYREGSSNGIEFGASSNTLAAAITDEEWLYFGSYLTTPATGPMRFWPAKRMIVLRTVEPDTAKLAAGEFGYWLDPTNGAAKFMLKGKTADGTVVTWAIPNGTVALATDLSAYVAKSLYDANTILAATTDDTPAALTVAASTILGRKASGNIAAMTATEAKAVLAIAESDVASLTTDLAAKVPKSLFDANTVLAADTDDTPAAVTMGASTILARLASGNIKAATPAEILTLLGAATDAEVATELADQKRVVEIIVTDPNGSAITTGDGKAYFVVPTLLNGHNLVAAHAAVTTVSSSGLPTVQIANVTDSVDMLSTKITIDASEFTSYTAAAAPVIDTTKDDVATGDILRVDIDVAGTGAKGLIAILTFEAP